MHQEFERQADEGRNKLPPPEKPAAAASWPESRAFLTWSHA